MKKKLVILGVFAAIIAIFSQCHKAEVFPTDEYDPRLSGGAATVFDQTSRAFTNAIAGLTGRDEKAQSLGDAAFEQPFIASTTAPGAHFTGLGPIFNNVSCISCHHNDGKGTPTAGFTNSSLLFRLSIPGTDPFGGPLAATGYGGQMQDRALVGVTPEASMNISYTEIQVTYPDGSTASLRKPTYTIASSYTAMPSGCLVSPRLAPPVFGLGLLELVPESTIQGFADEADANQDGISGRPNRVYNPQTQQMEIGRFGLKANTASIFVQVATAYNQDMGVTSSLLPVENCFGQPQADGLKDDPELPDSVLNGVAFYIKTLAVPARRDVTDATVLHGEQLFNTMQCASCHIPTMQTGVDVRYPALSNQRIHPYTDLLLHDMGPGLADNRPDYLASGTEWRTTPLWGVGLFEHTNGTPYYLHDGRARTLEEAILWHDGEGAKAKQQFMQLNATDRAAVIIFLRSL